MINKICDHPRHGNGSILAAINSSDKVQKGAFQASLVVPSPVQLCSPFALFLEKLNTHMGLSANRVPQNPIVTIFPNFPYSVAIWGIYIYTHIYMYNYIYSACIYIYNIYIYTYPSFLKTYQQVMWLLTHPAPVSSGVPSVGDSTLSGKIELSEAPALVVGHGSTWFNPNFVACNIVSNSFLVTINYN